MFVEEHVGKAFLREAGIQIPRGRIADDCSTAAKIARELNTPVVVKSQLPTGKRGKAGGIRFAADAEEAERVAREMLGSTIAGYRVERLLVEERIPLARELYAAVTTDVSRKCPLALFSTEGGIDIEGIHASSPDSVMKFPIDIRSGLEGARVASTLESSIPDGRLRTGISQVMADIYSLYRKLDAELIEINPLALTPDGDLMALDAKLIIDDAALRRHPEISTPQPRGTALELEAKAAGLLYVQLDGTVGLLANGAGLTMATMDAIIFHGGRPANFMEIGGEAYKKAAVALSIVLGHPGVKVLLVNLCGAYARTDVMVEGILTAWEAVSPQLPVAFSVRGTGEERAIELLRQRLGIEPYATMDDAVSAAVAMACGGT